MTAQSDQPAVPTTKVVQITNIAPQATKDQMQTLFGFLGKIEDIRLYPTIRDVSVPVQSRICYVKFFDAICVGVAQHMTNTVFIDRALIVTPYNSTTNDIPDEYRALEIAAQASVVPGLYGNNSKLPPHVTNQIEGSQPNQVITTHDPALVANNLPMYPPLPINYDSVRIEEIRRTLLISNLDPSVTAQQIIDFFSKAGDVKYVRFCKKELENGINYALIEFSEQTSIINALKLNGVEMGGKPITVGHSTVNIDKPQAKSNEAAQREIEEAMTRVKEAQNLISAAIDPVIGILSKDKKRGRSRSRSRRRSRSRSRGRRRRSRSRSRGRRRRSRSRKRSRSRSRKRTRSRDRKKRSRDRRKSRSRSRSRGSSRSVSKSKKTEKSKTSRSKEEKSKDKDKERSKDLSPIKEKSVKPNEKPAELASADSAAKDGANSPTKGSESPAARMSRKKRVGRLRGGRVDPSRGKRAGLCLEKRAARRLVGRADQCPEKRAALPREKRVDLCRGKRVGRHPGRRVDPCRGRKAALPGDELVLPGAALAPARAARADHPSAEGLAPHGRVDPRGGNGAAARAASEAAVPAPNGAAALPALRLPGAALNHLYPHNSPKSDRKLA
ncbi:hypothetical protein GE061_019454 [Apolygus lucorum]|uniref:RRM domain-containing protein n=1 Tax=Apolygus lucorum TaxID=248454 RepID=A0A8S9XCK1_APOLU|nr:hypothetical protein GE061_019454 [Apolygus lucorum]